jgi:hypothetical protein
LREPIGLTLSSIFENFSFFFQKPESVTLADYQDILLRPRAMNLAQQWFDWELKPFTGIDVYSAPFPRETGYAIYENRFARALVYRYEALGKLPAMLHEFLGCEVPAVLNRNIGSSKAYSQSYQETKEHLRLPSGFVASQCNSKMMQHFYSAEERRAFQELWTQKEQANA